MPKKKLKIILAFFLIIFGFSACQTQDNDVLKEKLTDILTGKKDVADLSFSYIEEHPMDWTLQFSFTGENSVAHVVQRSLKPACQAHWNKDCWESATNKLTVSDSDIRSLVEILINSGLTHATEQILPPGAEVVSIRVAVQGIEPINFSSSFQEFSSNPQWSPLRKLILKLIPMKKRTGDTPA